MFNSLQNFDPISFLQIDTSQINNQEELTKLRMDLYDKMGEYILYKLSNNLSDEQHKLLLTTPGSEILQKLQIMLPDLEQRMKNELENFKQDYQKQQ